MLNLISVQASYLNCFVAFETMGQSVYGRHRFLNGGHILSHSLIDSTLRFKFICDATRSCRVAEEDCIPPLDPTEDKLTTTLAFSRGIALSVKYPVL